MKVHYFHIRIAPDEWLRYYRGTAEAVLVTSLSGLRISIPAVHFRQFTTFMGIQGVFRLILNDDNTFVKLDQLRHY